jgi:hypothetical protein
MNHLIVQDLVRRLQALGLSVWIDEEQVHSNVMDSMIRGIDSSKVVVVCITERYVGKVQPGNTRDHCKLEFDYVARRKGAKHMVPLVMEAAMRDTALWTGPVAMVLGGVLYVDASNPTGPSRVTDAQAKKLAAMIRRVGAA